MIPIRDATRSKNVPVVNLMIIGLNVIVFFWQLTQGPHLEKVFYLYGIVPLRFHDPELAAHFTWFQQYLPFLSSMFLHGGFLHIIMNMWFLYIFGDNVEDSLGHFRYLFFYLFCGLTAGIIQLYTNWNSDIPTIGASGAISGVMGAYLLLYPRSKILTLVFIFFFIQFVEIPAFIFLGIWFFLQLVSAGLVRSHAGGIAFWAHIGGFIAGLVFIKLFDVIPRMGISRILSSHTERKSSPHIQTLSFHSPPEELDIHGSLVLTPREASLGARKIVSVPQGLKKRNFFVTIPPGVHEGTQIRLKGLGQSDRDGHQGDLFLEVRILG